MATTVDDIAPRLPYPAMRPRPSPAWKSLLVTWFCQTMLLFASTGSRLWIVAFIAAAGAWTLTRGDAAIAALRRNALIFVVPCFYLLSAIWSIYPAKTLYAVAQLFVTLALAISIASLPSRRAGATGLCLAYATFTIVSLAFGARVDWEGGLTAFSGMNGGKNFFGHTSALTSIMALGLLTWAGDYRRSPPVRLASPIGVVAIYAIGVYAVIAARATGSIIALGLATFAFFATLVAGRATGGVRFMILFTAAGLALLLALFGDLIRQPLLDVIFQTFHKTPDLSGRLYLWATADRIITDHPALGIGYNAFWTVGNPAAEGIWSLYGIKERFGYNFHNTAREILVEGGLVGLVVIAATMGALIVRQVGRALAGGATIDAVGVAVIAYLLSRTYTESVALGPWSSETIMLIFFLVRPAGGRSPVRDRLPRAPADTHRSCVLPASAVPPPVSGSTG